MRIKLIIIICALFVLSSCNGTGNQNFNDLKKIKIGMTHFQVDSIMRNDPESVKDAYWNEKLYVYYYDSGPGASDYFKIIFNKKDSLVVDIEYGD